MLLFDLFFKLCPWLLEKVNYVLAWENVQSMFILLLSFLWIVDSLEKALMLEGDDRGWDGWMASLALWTWVWVDSGSWWWTGRPGVLRFTGSQRVGHNWATELNWELKLPGWRPGRWSVVAAGISHSTLLSTLSWVSRRDCLWKSLSVYYGVHF